MALGAAGAVVTGGNPAGGEYHAPSGSYVLAGDGAGGVAHRGGGPAIGRGEGDPHPPPLSNPPRRRVAQGGSLRPDGRGGFVRRDIARWDEDTDSFAVLASDEDRRALADWCGISTETLLGEIDSREAFFARLIGDGMSSIREVNAAIERFYAEKIRPRRSA